jgi:hypothetical protein
MSPSLFTSLRTLDIGNAREISAADFAAFPDRRRDADVPFSLKFPFCSGEYPFSVLSSSSPDLASSFDSESESVVLMARLDFKMITKYFSASKFYIVNLRLLRCITQQSVENKNER